MKFGVEGCGGEGSCELGMAYSVKAFDRWIAFATVRKREGCSLMEPVATSCTTATGRSHGPLGEREGDHEGDKRFLSENRIKTS